MRPVASMAPDGGAGITARLLQPPGIGCYVAPPGTSSLNDPSASGSRTSTGGAPLGHGARPFDSNHRPIVALRNSLQLRQNESLRGTVTTSAVPPRWSSTWS